ncbi:glycosyltransferase [Thioalbus denitrificans]|uniref:Glycosyl transferase family 2 n=1 Tax=Thioalbus denitrificans TaxID=547122 RepID=A0A369CJI3_9GAMM|nr:glycosyltransferase [Thioalbus denitrificans]RCX33458.1 glycosyl transferase family 2 [Thioalbus denitrificans]
MANYSCDVSVCITSYNHEDYIRDCVMSVIAQREDVSLEVIIGDDCSNDKTKQILKKLKTTYPDIITVVRHEANLGYGALNLRSILPLTRGRYIAHLDGDDFWLPGKLRQQMQYMEKNDGCVAVCTNSLCLDKNGVALGVFNNQGKIKRISRTYLMQYGNFINHSTLLYKAELRESIIPPDGLFIDYTLLMNLASLGDIGYIDKILSVYRIGTASSVIDNLNEHVRSLYWESINKPSGEVVGDRNKRLASADFLSKVFYRSIKTRSMALMKKWWPIVSAEHREHKARLTLLAISNILITGIRLFLSLVASRIGGTRLRVIYWR